MAAREERASTLGEQYLVVGVHQVGSEQRRDNQTHAGGPAYGVMYLDHVSPRSHPRTGLGSVENRRQCSAMRVPGSVPATSAFMTIDSAAHGPSAQVVVLVSSTGHAAGAERALARLARSLPQEGFRPQAIILESGPLEQWLRDADCPVTVMGGGRLRQARKTILVVAAIRRRLLELRPIAVMSNMASGHIYGGLAAASVGTPAVWWQHGVPSASPIDIVAGAVPAAAVVCVSDDALSAQPRFSRRRAIVQIRPGVPVGEIAARRGAGRAVREQLAWEDHPVVGMVSRIAPVKDQDMFLRAAAVISRTMPQARFVLVGEALDPAGHEYAKWLRRLTHELGMADKVCFAGHQDDVYAWLDACDVVAHSAAFEPFGLVLVEAMVLGKPVLAVACDGPRSIVQHERSGLLVPVGDPLGFAAGVTRILNDPTLAAALGRAGEARARVFSEEKTASAFASLLRSVGRSDIRTVTRKRKASP